MKGLWLIIFMSLDTNKYEVEEREGKVIVFDKGYQLEDCKYHVELTSTLDTVTIKYMKNGTSRNEISYTCNTHEEWKKFFETLEELNEA